MFKYRYKLKIAFLMGTTKDKKGAMLVNQESLKYGDIVQGDFLDTYRNLTNKGVMGFRWVTKYCPHAQMVLKIDDDIFVNIFKIIGYYFPMYKRRKNLIMCNTVFPGHVQRRHSRWTVQSDDFRGRKFYPRYCSGFAVLMGTDTIRAFYQAAHITPMFWVDDVYLFGLLPNMAKITHRVLNRNVSLFTEQCEKSYKTEDPYLVACTASQTTQFMFYWKRSLKTLRSPIRQMVNDDVIAKALASGDGM
ncbi:UDP-GalNAc:beta-1,3-N-acetylgalactosaminyltransferase 1-like [Liolophura sinensis]|uniref:UDP-GalNAc:beta-1, 3-N-acetylgalactosaminyltransferase 1-like n=1 Tax=Liolophura sinensis TaxID=3198878 RepID=UPI0031587101